MASGKYGVRPQGWAKHKRNLDRPFWPKERAYGKKIVVEQEEEAETAQQEKRPVLHPMHAAKEKQPIISGSGPVRKTWCGIYATMSRTTDDPTGGSRITCPECKSALRRAGVYFNGGV